MGQIKSIAGVLFSRLIGFLIFILVMGLLNILVPYVDNITYTTVISFLNSNLWVIILFSLLMAGGELFSVLMPPFNLPFPLFNAIGSIFLIKFFFNIFVFVDTQLINVSIPGVRITLKQLFIIIAAIVFLIVLISGYVKLLVEMYSDKQESSSEKKVKKNRR